ncbi:MAG: hypothetical protein SGPRY_014814, partial [Prymnesium sp.]
SEEWLCRLDEGEGQAGEEEIHFRWDEEGMAWKRSPVPPPGAPRARLLTHWQACEYCGAAWPAGSITYNSFLNFRSKCKRGEGRCTASKAYLRVLEAGASHTGPPATEKC